MDERGRPFKTLSRRIAWSCPWYQVRQDEIVRPDGSTGIYNVIEKADAVWIVPITRDGQLVLIHQYRYTVDEWCWEVPAGSLKSGQSIEDAAQEELREEVGGEVGLLHYVGRFFMANGICSEVGHIFLATGVTLGETHHESAEVISVHMVSPAEAVDMARTGKISDGPTALAILLCATRPDFFRPDGP